MTNSIQLIAINDGEERWLAEKSALICALEELNWELCTIDRIARYYVEPESDDDEGLSPYRRLCNSVDSIPPRIFDDAIEQENYWDSFPGLIWNPSKKHWVIKY